MGKRRKRRKKREGSGEARRGVANSFSALSFRNRPGKPSLSTLYCPLLTGSQTTVVPGAPSRSIDLSLTSSCSFQSAANEGIESRERWLKILGWAKTQSPARPKKATKGEGF